MANRLQDVVLDPNSISSGKKLRFTVTYDADAAATGTIVCAPGFEIDADVFDVPAGQGGEKWFWLKIKRTTSTVKTCRLEFQLFQDRHVRRPEIT